MGVNALSELVEPSHGLLPRHDGSRAYEFHQQASQLFQLTLAWRRRCGNDSDAVFVYMAFILAAATEAVNEVSQPGVVSLAEIQASLSAFSIANMTGIPRETVRRKLRLLEQNGVISAGPGASYTVRLERSRLLEALQPRGRRPGGRRLVSAAADKVIPFPLHRVSPVFPRNPLFFCERLQYRGYNQKVIEYCVVDVFAERVLEFSAGWFRAKDGPEAWIPSNRALAGLTLLHETARGRVVIVDSVADEPPYRVLRTCAHLVELGALYTYNGVQALRPQIEDEVASIRLAAFDGETNAFQTAVRLREVWVLLDAELRGVRTDPPPQAAPPPRPGPLQSPGPVAGPGPAAPPRSARGWRWRDCGDRLVSLAAWTLVALAALAAFVGVIFAHRDVILMELRHRVRL